MGKRVRRPSLLNQEVALEIQSCQDDHSFQTVLAGTMCTDDFYEGLCCVLSAYTPILVRHCIHHYYIYNYIGF